MKRHWLTDHPAALIFALALVLRVAWVLTLDPGLAWPDEEEFVTVARHLSNGDGFVANSYRSNPILPIYLSAVFSTVGENYLIARLGQSLFGALTCVLVYNTGALLLGPGVALLSGLLLAVYPPHIFLSGVFYVECLYSLVVSLALYLVARGVRGRGGIGQGVLTGVACGITILTRAIFAAYVPLLCLAWIIATPTHRARRLAACGALVLAMVVTVLPWTLRNYNAFNRFLPVSSGFYTTLWQGNNALANGNADDRFLFWDTHYWSDRLRQLDDEERERIHSRYTEVAQQARQLQEHTRDRYLATDDILKPLAIEYITSDPMRTATLFLRKLRTLYTPFTPMDTTNQFSAPQYQRFAAITFYPVLALALYGACLGLGRARQLASLYFFIASMSGAYALLTACTRYRLPMDPYLIMFAALAIVSLWERARVAVTGAAPRRVGPVFAVRTEAMPRSVALLRDSRNERDADRVAS